MIIGFLVDIFEACTSSKQPLADIFEVDTSPAKGCFLLQELKEKTFLPLTASMQMQ